jgi:hypothetical protein
MLRHLVSLATHRLLLRAPYPQPARSEVAVIERLKGANAKDEDEFCILRAAMMSDASEFLTKWVRKNITIHNDTLTAGRLAEECLWEAQGENLSEAEVNEAANGNLLTFMVAALNRAAEQKIDGSGNQ